MKISIDDLEKALTWIKANTRELMINVIFLHDGKLTLKCVDKYEVFVEITLFNESTMLPKIRKEDILR